MKRIAVVVIINLILCVNGRGQNLVPNPSFENIDTCWIPSGAVYLGYELFWDSPSGGNPDVYNICSVDPGFGVPNSAYGFQYPHTGNGYVGSVFWSTELLPQYREYLQVELDSPLVANQQYCASFYISLANDFGIACDNFGIYFSSTHTFIPTMDTLTGFVPQINITNVLTDTANWTLIYGQYTAMGGERYIIIGNFYPNSQTDTAQVLNPPSLYGNGADAYYYIDDINVHCCTCDSLNHEGISELTKETEITISPNPATTSISITATNNIKEIKLINLLGEEVIITNYQLRISPSTPLRVTDAVSVDVSSVSKGIYFVEVTDAKDNVINRKVVVQ